MKRRAFFQFSIKKQFDDVSKNGCGIASWSGVVVIAVLNKDKLIVGFQFSMEPTIEFLLHAKLVLYKLCSVVTA